MEKNIIEVRNFVKKFKEFSAVDNISFSVKQGELFGFIGVNGAGKSTTINTLCTLAKKTSGSINICGFNIESNSDDIRRRIGVVFQNNSLDDFLTVKDNLLFRAYLYEKDRVKVKRNLDKVCQMLNIGHYLNKQYKYLSGGQKRSCDIARALINNPEILFLDEPTTGLDPKTRKNLWKCLDEIRKEDKMTIFLTTHYMEEAAKAQSICVMHKGAIAAEGTPFELKEKYSTDVLKIESNNNDKIKKILNQYGYNYKEETNRLNIAIKSTKESIKIINLVEQYIKSFEVMQGTMEDAFLNITGVSLKEE